MSMNNFVRGGQTTAHTVRMIKQVARLTFGISLGTVLFVDLLYVYWNRYDYIQAGDFSVIWNYLDYQYNHFLQNDAPLMNDAMLEIFFRFKPLLIYSGIGLIVSSILILLYFKYSAKSRFADKIVHGLNLVPLKSLKKLIKQKNHNIERMILRQRKKHNKERMKLSKELDMLKAKQQKIRSELKATRDFIRLTKDKLQDLNIRSNGLSHKISWYKFTLCFRREGRYNQFKRLIFISDYIYYSKRIFAIRARQQLISSALEDVTKVERYVLAEVEYPLGAENTHTLIVGTTGTGKTVSINALLDKVRSENGKAIIYDKMGTFTEKFYDSQKDVLLNPFDKRSASWSIFKEIEKETDWNLVAEAIIPSSKSDGGDNFWENAGRTLFTSAGLALQQEGETSTEELVKLLLKVDLSEVAKKVKGLPAAGIISDDSKESKTALSVRAVLTTHLACLQYIREDSDTQIKLRDWIRNDKTTGFLILTSGGDIHASVRGLITMWLEIIINTLLSLPKNDKRKLWFILDELPSLYKIPSLQSALAESRQYGGAFLLSTQTWVQMEEAYGQKGASSLAGLARTRLLLAQADEQSAKWTSDNLGTVIKEVSTENISYGADQVRDGVSNSMQERREVLVTPTEITNLANLTGYLKFPEDLPIAKVHMKYKHYKKCNAGFVAVDNFYDLKNKIDNEIRVAENVSLIQDDANGLSNFIQLQTAEPEVEKKEKTKKKVQAKVKEKSVNEEFIQSALTDTLSFSDVPIDNQRANADTSEEEAV